MEDYGLDVKLCYDEGACRNEFLIEQLRAHIRRFSPARAIAVAAITQTLLDLQRFASGAAQSQRDLQLTIDRLRASLDKIDEIEKSDVD